MTTATHTEVCKGTQGATGPIRYISRLGLCLMFLFAAATVQPTMAEATPNNPTVKVDVRARCTGPGSLTLKSPSIGTKRYSWSNTSSTGYRQVSVTLRNVPSGKAPASKGGGAPNGGKGTYLSYHLRCTTKVGIATRYPRASGTWGIARPLRGNQVNKAVCAYTHVKPCRW